jgi:hypothetical protein
MKKYVTYALAFVGILGIHETLLGSLSITALAAPESLQLLHAQCTTAGTSPGGAGQNCADTECASAPEGYVIIRDAYQVTENSNNGGWHGIAFSDLVELIPGSGITGPRKVCISVGANSEGGLLHAGPRGWIDVTGQGSISRYKN